MNFLTSAEKIKKIRKDLKMNQNDLVADGITRPFISMVESGKRGISRDTAEAITEIFNKRAKELSVDLYVDVNYLMRTSSEDALEYCLEKLNDAKSISDFKDIIEISTEFKFEVISAKTYHRLGDLYFKCNSYADAFVTYNMSLDLYKNTDKKDLETSLYNSIGRCKFKQLQYTDALFYFERASYYSITYNNDEIRRLSTYNLALCFKKLNKIDTALNYLNDLLPMYDINSKSNEYVYGNILKANCYEIQNDLDKSLSIYDNLISRFSNKQDPLLSMVYNNLGLLYLKKKEYIKSLDYFNIAQKIRTDNDVCNLHHTIIEKSNVFMKQGLYDEAILLIKLGLEMAGKFNDTEYLLKGNYLLSEIYTTLNDQTYLEKTYASILSILKGTNDNGQILKIHNTMAIMYLKQNNLNKVENCLKMSQIMINTCYNYD